MKKSVLMQVHPVTYVILAIAAVIFIIPLYMTMITALKDPAEIFLPKAWDFPSKLHFKSFSDAAEKLMPNFINSVVLTFFGTLISSLIGSINGYIFSKKKFPGSEIIFVLFIFGMFIPYQIILIPLFQTLKFLRLYGSIPGLIFAHVVYGIPIVTLLFRNFYDQMPDSIVESAMIDGTGFVNLYIRIFFPLSIPCFMVVGIWQCTQIWNEFLWGICLTKAEANPITVGLSYLAGGQAVKWNLPMAGAIIAGLPIALIFIIMGRYFIRGLLAGSVKG